MAAVTPYGQELDCPRDTDGLEYSPHLQPIIDFQLPILVTTTTYGSTL